MVALIKSMMGGWELSGDQLFGDNDGLESQKGGSLGDDRLASRRGGWLGEEATGRGGWRDDRMQLKLPEETAAALKRCFSTCNLHLI